MKQLELIWWQIVPWLRVYVREPVVSLIHRKAPTALLVRRLEPMGDGWYRIPDIAASVHVHRRLDPDCRAREDDLIRIVGGRAVAFGWIETDGSIGSATL